MYLPKLVQVIHAQLLHQTQTLFRLAPPTIIMHILHKLKNFISLQVVKFYDAVQWSSLLHSSKPLDSIEELFLGSDIKCQRSNWIHLNFMTEHFCFAAWTFRNRKKRTRISGGFDCDTAFQWQGICFVHLKFEIRSTLQCNVTFSNVT